MAVALLNGATLDANADADATGGWNAGNQDTDSQIEGTACVGAKTGNGTTRYLFTNSTTLNFSTNPERHIYIWYNFLTAGFLSGTDGVLGFVGNATTNNYLEYVATQITAGTYFGGWANVVISGEGLVPIGANDNSAGTYSNTAADVFGIRYTSTSNIMGNFNNGLVDQITIAEGLVSTGTGQSFADFVAAENTNVYGIFLTQNGIFFPQGKIYIGDGTITTAFTSSGETVVFTDQRIATNFYEVRFRNNATVTFGNLSGGVTSSGTTIGCANTLQSWTLTCDTGAVVNLYSSSFDCVTSASLNSTTTGISSTFSNAGQIDLNGATLTDCIITSSTTGATSGALKVDTTAEILNVTGCTFTNNTNAIEITTAGTYDLDELTFSGNTAAIYFSPTSGDLTLNLVNGTTPLSGTKGVDVVFNAANTAGVLTVNNNVQVSISGLLGNTEVSVLESPSPYSQTLAEQQAGSGPVSLFNTDFVSAVTGTDIELDTGGGANVTQILRSGTTDFTDMTGLVAGDFVRVSERITGKNLRTFDTFEVVSVSASAISVVDVASSGVTQQGLLDGAASGKTVTVEKIDATYTFSVSAGTPVDILLFRVGSLPILLLEQTITASNSSFPVSQTLDRNFEV